MKFNAVTCVFMSVTNKKNSTPSKYHLDKDTLEQKNMVKYLGVTIDNKLTFDKHIKEKTKSATKILNMFHRNLYFAPKSVKYKAYMKCVLPVIEYASNCWSPTSEKMNNLIEMVQHNAARFISNVYIKKGNFKKYSVTKILNDLKLNTIQERRNQARLTMAYKILHGHVILKSNLLPKYDSYNPKRHCNTAKVGKEYQLMEQNANLQIIGHTFFFSIPKLWNQMVTPKQAKAPSVEAFQRHFKQT